MTRVLIDAVLRVAMFVFPITIVLIVLVFGSEHALGVVVGGVLALGSGLGLVYLTTKLLDPRTKKSKGAMMGMLVGKLAAVALLLWIALAVAGISGLGIIFGVGASVLSMVVGLNQGSSSPAGQRAMAEDEAEIARELERELGQDLEDKGEDPR
ncbi:hypothetical protein L6R52_00875 [Myxococcota bacterium]|nr:hypothetical protein [Myxococcota bacterium]